jgi:TatD DNase family protein
MILVDTHLHLDFEQYDADRDAVLERAEAAEVRYLITIGIDAQTCGKAIALAERYPNIYAAVGLHPNSADEWNADFEQELRQWALHPKVVAIGEIGLDYYWKRVPAETQQAVFEAQLAVASETGLPIIIHDRDAHADTLATLKRWVQGGSAPTPPGVLHCFSGDMAMAEEALTLGFYLGVDGPVTYKKAQDLQELVAALPLDRLLIETDAPFLTPHPYRGKRNEPAYVYYVAEQLARLHNTTLDQVAAQTTRNVRTLFGKLDVS